MLKLGVICSLSLCVGAGIGWTARGRNSPPETASRAAAQAEPPVAAQAWVPMQPVSGPTLDIAQLRAVLREELAAERASGGNGLVRGSPTVDELAPPPALVAARR